MGAESDGFNSDQVIEFKAEGAREFETGDYTEMGWRGLVDNGGQSGNGESHDPPAIIATARSDSRDGLDMTPMVDVTFLLLIFFMVTASFAIQKSIEHPQAQSDQGGEVVPVSNVVEVQIDQNNVYFVSSHEVEIECPSEREMRSQLKGLLENASADRMIIRAHVDSKHNRVVSAWDAGRVAGLEDILFKTTEEEL